MSLFNPGDVVKLKGHSQPMVVLGTGTNCVTADYEIVFTGVVCSWITKSGWHQQATFDEHQLEKVDE